MGRAHEVRAKSMAQTAAARSALFMRASKEIYMAAKSGVPDPNSNLALRSVIDKYKGQNVTKDVIERAIKKAAGGEEENYISGRYEGYGPGNVSIIVDSLTSNVRRAFDSIRNVFNKKGGHLGSQGSVSFNFKEVGLIEFVGSNLEEVEEALILADIDLDEVKLDDDLIVVTVEKTALMQAKKCLMEIGIQEFSTCEITMLPLDTVTLEGEDKEKFEELLAMLDELEDVQDVYHNAKL